MPCESVCESVERRANSVLDALKLATVWATAFPVRGAVSREPGRGAGAGPGLSRPGRAEAWVGLCAVKSHGEGGWVKIISN